MEDIITVKSLLAIVILLLGIIVWFGKGVIGDVKVIRKELNDIGIRYTYMVEEVKKTAEGMLKIAGEIKDHDRSIQTTTENIRHIEKKVNGGGKKDYNGAA